MSLIINRCSPPPGTY